MQDCKKITRGQQVVAKKESVVADWPHGGLMAEAKEEGIYCST
ncbi:hypothetical protein PROFUN_16506 [Planoprotostelium fungivorum]|uniref:Uncharacterized protein n=1 Tax=Planoprotostelium fungivorum TaxID=1890364 RepID=A0A2P6MQ86_9EUKA|nr:hypothetical protein PROFUN_16506 [Planoprotostelium fungivorum]